MRLTRRIKIQLAVFAVVSLVAGAYIVFGYINIPALFFGVGRYTVTVKLPQTGGLYESANVTYRGTEVGRVKSVQLTDSGVNAVLSLNSGIDIPSDLQAQVHSQSAVGEQYVELLPRKASPPLKNGDVIALGDTSVPPDINSLLDAANRGLEAIPRDNLKTVIDESYIAIHGLGPEISRIVKGSTQLAIDAHQNLDALTTLADESQPLLDSQANTSDSIRAWAAHLATLTDELRTQNAAVAGVLQKGGQAAAQARQLVERLQPALPILLANMVTADKVAIAYQPAIEQLLVLLPEGIADLQGAQMMNLDYKTDFGGQMQNFKMNLNMTPPCTTGYLPAQQIRSPALVDSPERTDDLLYCRIPQNARTAVRGMRNLPCLTVPGKRAPTVKMCESNEQYVPLNDGNNWKGDPNATLSGQDVPQPDRFPPAPPPPGRAPPAGPAPIPPIGVAEYDPATGSYVGPDGHVYTQTDLAQQSKEPKTWQTMLTPPTPN